MRRDVRDRRERRHDQRHRRDDALLGAVRLAPVGPHRQRVLADRYGDAQLRAQFLRHRTHRRVQRRVFAALAARRHPVGRQADLRQRRDVRRQHVGDRLRHRQAPGGGRIEQRHRAALADGERFSRASLVVGERHRHVAHRHLPRSDQLIAADETADGAIADGDEKGLVGHRRQAQHAVRGLARDRARRRRSGGARARRSRPCASGAAACRAAPRAACRPGRCRTAGRAP